MAIKERAIIDYKLLNLEVESLEQLKIIEKDLLFKYESSKRPSFYKHRISVTVKSTGEVYNYKVVKENKNYYIVTA